MNSNNLVELLEKALTLTPFGFVSASMFISGEVGAENGPAPLTE